MKNSITNIYANLSPERNEAVFSGIKFADFIECTLIPIENILLLSPIDIGEKYCHNFELIEGKDNIAKLKLENIYRYGNFNFVDYANNALVNSLSKEQVAELLYLAHMYEPLKTPFFDKLQNNYAYLSHDDGWYCKLYCKEWQASTSILLNKLLKCIQQTFCDKVHSLPDSLTEKITELSTRGLLIQLDIEKQKNKPGQENKCAAIKLYEVGEYENMDKLFNNLKNILSHVSYEIQLNMAGDDSLA